MGGEGGVSLQGDLVEKLNRHSGQTKYGANTKYRTSLALGVFVIAGGGGG